MDLRHQSNAMCVIMLVSSTPYSKTHLKTSHPWRHTIDRNKVTCILLSSGMALSSLRRVTSHLLVRLATLQVRSASCPNLTFTLVNGCRRTNFFSFTKHENSSLASSQVSSQFRLEYHSLCGDVFSRRLFL